MQSFTNLPIGVKLFIGYTVMAVTVFSLGLSLYYIYARVYLEGRIRAELSRSNQAIADIVETTAKLSIKNYLRAIAEKNLETVRHLHQDCRNGRITEKEAKEAAAKIFLKQKIGATGYIYCVDSHGVPVVHPNIEMIGRNMSGNQAIHNQIQKKTGYLEYVWKNPREVAERSKALYMVYFEPWDWIISVSSYKAEFSKLISIEDFREQIQSMAASGLGYSFVMDVNSKAVVHPKVKGDWAEYARSIGADTIETMIREKKGGLFYEWKSPQDSRFEKKIMIYEILPDFNWIIASSLNLNAAFAPLKQMRTIFIVILAATIFVMGAGSFIVGRAITRPLIQMIKRFNAGMEGALEPISVTSGQKNEIGLLESSYNQFVQRLETYRKSLEQENSIRKEAESRLLLFEKIFEHANEGIYITTADGEIQAVNQAFTAITGYEANEVIGKNPRVLKSHRHDREFYDAMWASIHKEGYWAGEIWNRRKSGEAFPEFLNISTIKDEKGETKNFVAVFHDIKEMKTKEQQIEHLAYHDPLTGLPNRALLRDRLENAIAVARRGNEMVQLIFIDLDNFKLVNDSAGHAKGDELLKEAAQRMLSVTRSSDTVARLGGDEFIIMATKVTDMMGIIRVVERIRSAFLQPFIIETTPYHLTCSIGIAMFPNDGDDVDTLVRNADLAMYHSKAKGKDRFFMFEPEMAKKITRRIEMETDMRKALDNKEFQVYFQPQVNNQTLKPVGMEALARWVKKDGTIVSPGQFIPVAEESGLIIPIGRQIFENALENAGRICEQADFDLVLSVNASARQFDEKGFESMVSELLAASGFPANRLKIEITESLLMKDIDTAMNRLAKLSAMGVSTAIDDFGTGYSSLAYLKQMSISTLKIDKSFIDDLPGDPDAHALVETIVVMAGKLGMGVVAEGVETQEQVKTLQKLGNVDIQGYVFAKPMPWEDTIQWMQNWQSNG